MPITSSFKCRTVLGTVIATVLGASPNLLQAQALEEIVVTAQRRTQNLQEVPISIETFSAAQIQEQGFRNMEDISAFSPGIYVNSGVQDQQVTIRGFGTIGNSLTLEQAVPIFLDGIHYGRQSQIKTAFLDVDRVEVLKGPQPVFFGQSASAGAFNIQSKGPTDVWEGDLNLELGNNGTFEGSAGAGGPINDTWGVRVAVTQEESDGFLRNAITEEKYPKYFYQGGRITLAYEPTDNFKATTKVDYSKLRNGSEAVLGCLTNGTLVYGRQGPFNANTGLFVPGNATTPGSDQSIWDDAPRGVGMDIPHLPISEDCFEGNVGLSNQGPYFQPPDNIREQDMTSGFMDVREAAQMFTSQGNDGISGLDSDGILGNDNTDAWSGNVNMEYVLANDVAINWQTGYNYYWRSSVKDNRHVPFFTNYQGREENYDQWSSELRFTSATGGTIEWMAGLSWQDSAKDNYSSSLRPNTVRGQRFNSLWEDVTWQNAFATLTWNFMDDKASIDIGARYSKIEKEVFINGYAAAWVFDVTPAGCPGVAPACPAVQIPASQVRGLVAGANTANLWYIPYGASNANYLVSPGDVAPFTTTNRVLPLEWYPSRAAAVGLSQPDFRRRLANETAGDAPVGERFTDNFLDPTITLRYRISENHSLFARFAEAAKAAGYDTGQTTIPTDIDEMRFENELGRSFELGSKGNLWDGRVRYDVTLFRTDFIDLQLSGLAPLYNENQTSVSLNAGKQRVQGLEFGFTAAATDRLTVGMQGAFMDGKMTEFDGSSCNSTELYSAWFDRINPAFTPKEDVLTCILFEPDGTTNYQRLDRSGADAPRTPDWKFVGDVRYVMPVWDTYELTFIGKGYVSDGFITDRSGFSYISKFNQHGDLNLQVALGPQDGKWKVSTYANNIFEARESYNPEYDVAPSGLATAQVTRSNFMTYGLKFNYNFGE